MEKNCDTCIYKADESKDQAGNRLIDCEANERQLYMPYAEDCVHWEKKLGE